MAMTRSSPRNRRTGGTPAKVQEALARLERLYKLGRASRRRHPERMAAQQVGEEARRHGINPETLRKARAVAEAYDEAEIRHLCQQARASGHRLTLEHLARLLSVPDRRTRERLTRRVVREGWSRDRLDDEIRRRYGRRRQGGRPPAAPKNATEARTRLHRAAEEFRREYAVLSAVLEAERDEGRPPAWRRRADQIDQEMRRLVTSLERFERDA